MIAVKNNNTWTLYTSNSLQKWYLQGILYTYTAFDYRTLPPFAKIMQRFILMQNA